jgi:C1A family cysteine protease
MNPHARQHFYGWKPSLPDPTVHIARPSQDLAWETEVLEEVDRRGNESPVKDQGQLGSCTSNALTATLENRLVQIGLYEGPLSRLFLYYLEREMEGTVQYDSGAYGHDGFKAMRKLGVPLEEAWPYDITRFTERPPEACYDPEHLTRCGQYVHPGLPYSMGTEERAHRFQWFLTHGKEIAFGFSVFESFESVAAADTGIIPVPEQGEELLGGHEVLMVGYLKDYPDHVLVRNSWGTEWGLDGYCLMPWEIAASPNYADDWRAIA